MMKADPSMDRYIDTPKFTNDSPVSDILLKKESSIAIVVRKQNNNEFYKNFDESFKIYLSKLPRNDVRKYVEKIFSDGRIFIGINRAIKSEIVFSRVMIAKNTKFIGIILDSSNLDIDIETGDPSSVDECIYASYFGIIRGSVLINSPSISKDMDLHKLLSTYINLIVMKTLGRTAILNDKQKAALIMLSAYAYFKHFINMRHSQILSTIKKEFNDLVSKEYIDEFLPLFEKISKYNTLHDIPKMLIDLNLYNGNPGSFLMSLIKIMGNAGFYSFIGTLDYFISMIVVCKYPTELYNKGCLTTSKLHDSIEDVIIKYIDKMPFEKPSVMIKD